MSKQVRSRPAPRTHPPLRVESLEERALPAMDTVLLILALLGLLPLTGCAERIPASPPPRKAETVALVKPGEARPAPAVEDPSFTWQLPRAGWKLPFQDEQPIHFISRAQAAAEWDRLEHFWNEATEKAVDPATGKEVERTVVKIKVPLGLTQSPPVPAENPPTVAKWRLGKQLYFDPILSSDNTVRCASCHDPAKGWTDQRHVSLGIKDQRGGVSAPTVLNAAYNALQFWDGRAVSLEHQCQGPPQNPIEMFDGNGDAWRLVVERVRSKAGYGEQFKKAFGTEPTRDVIAKAIATFERTALSGNSIHDRAELAMRRRVEEEETGKFEIQAKDYEAVLKEALARKDLPALTALGLDPEKDAAKLPAVAGGLNNGRALFFGKARCSSCHAGDNFTDQGFHNVGVGVNNGELPAGGHGRFDQLQPGHKNPELMGAFKTPTLRGLVTTAPYMHDGSEATLETVVDFYDRGGNAHEHLDAKMRDFEAEKAYLLSKQGGPAYQGPDVRLFGPEQKPVVPLKLNLTGQEKKDLVLFLKALQGDPVDPIVAEER
jgi:cytochrome c peroxidase